MGCYVTKQSDNLDYGYREYVIDTIDDLSSVPIDRCSPGSTCFCITGSKVFMLNTEKEWKEL